MPNSRLIPVQFMDKSAPSAATADSVAAALSPRQLPSQAPRPAAGEFVMSGSLTPPDSAGSALDLPGVPAAPMPGYHHRKEVQLMLRRWRNSVSLWARILSGQTRGPWDDSQRFTLPQHITYIK